MSSHTPGHGQDQDASAHAEHNILTPHGKETIKKYGSRIGWL